MPDFSSEVRRRLLITVTLFGFVESQLSGCSTDARTVYLKGENECIYMCSTESIQIAGYLLCEADGLTAAPCKEPWLAESADVVCIPLACWPVSKSSQCSSEVKRIQKAQFVISVNHPPKNNETLFPTYVHTETKPNTRWSDVDIPRITSEEPNSQMYIYGILSFFFGVIAFFIFALVFRFFHKRYQRRPLHVHTFSGHHLPLGSLHLRSFLSPSAPQMAFPNTNQGIPGLDLPPSYVVASELLDPPPSYDEVSKPKGHSAQIKVTSL